MTSNNPKSDAWNTYDDHLRRTFAAAAIQGMLAAGQKHDDEEALAIAAWAYADALLATEHAAAELRGDELAQRIERATAAAVAADGARTSERA